MEKTAKVNKIDIISGPLFVNILRFMLPLIVTNLLQQFFHAADVVIVGLSPEPDGVGAVGSTGSFLSLIRNIYMGFSVGTNVVVARCIGLGDKEKISRVVHTSVSISVIFGLIGSVAGIILTRPVLVGMGYTGNLLRLAARYAYIRFLFIPLSALLNFLGAIIRAQGNTKTPMLILSFSGVLNVCMNLFFVLVTRLSVEGVAIATGLSQLISVVLMWRYLLKKGNDCRISFNKLRIHREEFIEVFGIGFPAGIQNSLFSLSNMVIQSSILQVNNLIVPTDSAYAPVIKGNASASSIENFFVTALGAVTATSSTFTAQNAGANKYDRIRKSLHYICLISGAFALIMSLFGILLRQPLLALYGVRKNVDFLGDIAYNTAITRMTYKWPLLCAFAVMNACSGAIRGLGKSTMSAAITFVGTCAFRVVWIYTVFAWLKNLESIYISYPISWLITGALFFVIVHKLINNRIKENENRSA
ncbi:MAG: MATE family efflux transporter [Clostridia bacterium]|nr:MATE family efflux transporter [Clostridia bacterium]